MRVTTRQDFQLHGILKGDLHSSIAAINTTLLTTLGGCGDQERNIMCCPAPSTDRFHGEVLRVIAELVPALTPVTGAYHEIWLDGEPAVSSRPEEEPLYGDQYLPRKFKTAIALEGDNCVDVYANDLALVAMRGDDDRLAGFNVMVGGGLGRTHNKPETYPAVARPMAWVPPEHVVEVSRAVVAVQRDWGNRSDRRHARLKYLIADRGLDWFRDRVQEHLSVPLVATRATRRDPVEDHLGWHEQGDGRLYLGLYVENGRIADTEDMPLRTALRRIVEEFRPQVRLTAQQNVILADVRPGDRDRIDQLLHEAAVQPVEALHPVVRNAMACPALPTCGLAVAESERVLPALIRRLAGLMDELGLGDEAVSYRMTGCPNGCVRPYLGDVGFVGTTLGKYDVLLGGDPEGTRLNTLFVRNAALDRLPDLLRGPLTAFRDERNPGEGFGDWCDRIGVPTLSDRFGTPAGVPA
jgi:sulfite reductase (ferredoxin)